MPSLSNALARAALHSKHSSYHRVFGAVLCIATSSMILISAFAARVISYRSVSILFILFCDNVLLRRRPTRKTVFSVLYVTMLLD